MPRLRRALPGQPIRAQDWNELCDVVERNTISAVYGAEAKRGVGGMALWVPPAGSGLFIASVTSSPGISAATDATHAGTGSIQRYLGFDSGTGELGDLNGADEDCFNYHDKQFNTAATVLCSEILGVVWVLDVWSCTALT